MKYQKLGILAASVAVSAAIFGFHAVAAVPAPAAENAVTATENGRRSLFPSTGRGAMEENGVSSDAPESGMLGGALGEAAEEGSEMLSDVTDHLMSGDGALGDTDDRDGQVDGTSGENAGDSTDTAESSSGTTGDDGMSIWGVVIVLGVIAAGAVLLFALMPGRKKGM